MRKVKLFCFPFAGGSRYSYAGFQRHAPAALEVIPVDLPGRGKRFREKLLTDMDAVVEDAYRHLAPQLDGPYAIYGHSMGSIVGYLLAHRLQREGKPQPLHLFFTGRGGPSVQPDGKEPKKYLLSREDFVRDLVKLGGCPEGLLSDPALVAFFEPILRADFQAVEEYAYREAPPLEVPIGVLIGAEEDITREEALAWQRESTGPVQVGWLPGEHFFIYQHEACIMQWMAHSLGATPPASVGDPRLLHSV
jgi:surfactin synthase thioesterase subunit